MAGDEQEIKAYRSDQWTLGDDLAMGRAGDQVARMALEVEPPFTLGVTGKWGAGKTSVLRRAFFTLGGQPLRQAVMLGDSVPERADDEWKGLAFSADGRSTVLEWDQTGLTALAQGSLSVWYSPWQHQNSANPLIPLLLEIRAQFGAWSRIKEAAGKFNRRGGLAAAKLLEHVVDAAGTLFLGKNVNVARGVTDAVRQGWKEAEPELDTLSDGQRFHLLFEDAIKEVLLGIQGEGDEPAEDTRLIVFIDDLDRCEESVVVTLLESIKLYLSSRRCVFVLGIDDAAVLGALSRVWSDRSDDDNREYLEKLFQAILPVPQPRPLNVRAAVEAQLEVHGFQHAKTHAQDIEQLLEPNPRKVKNFVNSLCATWQLFRSGIENIENGERKLLLFHYLRLYHRPVWRLLERQPKALPFLHGVLMRGGAQEGVAKQPGLDEAAQRMMVESFSRAFSRVLKHDGDDDEVERHLRMPLEQAVTLFEQRLDRKRSDEYFLAAFTESVAPDEGLNDAFLYLQDSVKPE